MKLEQRVETLEDEVKILKNEVKSVLLDIREHYLAVENPFGSTATRAEKEYSSATAKESAQEWGQEEQVAEQHASPGQDRPSRQPGTQQTGQQVNPRSGDGHKGHQVSHSQSDGASLSLIAGLTGWVDRTTQRIGKRRAEALIEGLEALGYLSATTKDFLLKFISFCDAKEPEQAVTAKDYLAALAQLEGLLGESNTSQMALISMLTSNGRDDR
jgi:archaellum component FlaD/FlaE